MLYSADDSIPAPLNLYTPLNEPLQWGENPKLAVNSGVDIKSEYVLPYILADVLTTNPLFGDIDAVNEPDFNIFVSNDRFAILIFVKPLPSP